MTDRIKTFWLERVVPWETDPGSGHYLYRRSDTGALLTLRDAPPGAMWDAFWMMDETRTGPDGLTLVVRLPNGSDWCPDSQCSNCTKDQYERVQGGGRRWTGRTHWCWVRHGDPRSGDVHVDKDGVTCSAGGGSIQNGTWHGFLHHGYLVSG